MWASRLRFEVSAVFLAVVLAGAAASAGERESGCLGQGRLGPCPPSPWEVIGRSLQGRDVLATTIGTGEVRVYLIAGIHGDERPGRANADRLVHWLSQKPPPGNTVRVVQDANPDGTFLLRRANARGVDLNRNWPSADFVPAAGHGPEPLSEPETRALADDLEAFDPDVVIVFHAARAGPSVNWDGPAAGDAVRFAAAASVVDARWGILPSFGYPTPGSLGTWLGVDQAIPVLSIELGRYDDGERAWPGLWAGLLTVFDD